MTSPVTDPDLLTRLLGRRVLSVEGESAMGMQRVVALGMDNGVRFALPAGNALRSAGEIAEVRALLSGLSRQAAAAIRRQVGPGDPQLAWERIEAVLALALADPDAIIGDPDRAGFPLSRP